MRDVLARGLGDVDREIADALEVGVDLDGRDDRPQIDGHRLVERQQREAAAIELDVEPVQWLVAADHAIDQIAIAVDQPFDCQPHLLFGEAAHLEQPSLQMLELLLKMTDVFGGRHYPNLPVT